MKCEELQGYFITLKYQQQEFLKLLELFEQTGDEQVMKGCEYWMAKMEKQAKDLRFELTHCSEQEALEIMGEDQFVGTLVAQEVFDASIEIEKYQPVPFSTAELLEAKREGKVLIFRPAHTWRNRPMAISAMVMSGLNDPSDIKKQILFRGAHVFDFGHINNMIQNSPQVKEMHIEKSNWSMLGLSQFKATFDDVKSENLHLPTVAEAVYDLLASKKVSEFYRKMPRDEHMLTSENVGDDECYAIQSVVVDGKIRFNPVIVGAAAENWFYTSEKRVIE